MNAVIYAKCSSNNTTEKSIENQIKACKEYAKKNNYKIVNIYKDGENSRIAFQKMIADSKSKKFQAIIIYQLDRFARNRYDLANYQYKLKKNGVKIISTRENLSEDPSKILLESVLESFAEYYSQELSQRIKAGIARKKKEKEKIANEG